MQSQPSSALLATIPNQPITSAAPLHSFLMAGIASFALVAAFFQVSCVDPGFHIRTAAAILESGTVPATNTFAGTQPDAPWILHQWIPTLAFFAAWHAGGIIGLILFKACIVAILFLLVFRTATREAAGAATAATVTTLAIVMARVRFFERPDIFSALFLAMLLNLLRSHRRHPFIRLAAVPTLMGLWAACHAGVIYGFILLAAWLIGDLILLLRSHKRSNHARRTTRAHLALDATRAALALATAAATTTMTSPHGTKGLLLPLTYFCDPFWHGFVEEFLPPAGRDFAWLTTFTLAGMLLLLLLLLAARRNRPDPRMLTSFVIFALLAYNTQRSLLMFAVIAPPCICHLLARNRIPWQHRIQTALYFLPPTLWIGFAAFSFSHDTSFRFGPGLYPPFYPMTLYARMQHHLIPGPMYNDMMYGGGILWFLYPQWKPFIDGRFEAYTKEFWRDTYVPVSTGDPIWHNVFTTNNIQTALVGVPRNDSPKTLAAQLRADPLWALVDFDDNALLFVHRQGPNAAAATNSFTHLWPANWRFDHIPEAEWQATLVEAEQAVLLAPNSLYARTARARMRLLLGSFDQAATDYAWLVARGNASSAYWRDYAYALFMAGQLDSANSIATHMIQANIDPQYGQEIRNFITTARANPNPAPKITSAPTSQTPK